MEKLPAGLGAGFVATLVLSALMVAKGMMGLMPDLNVIAMLSTMMGGAMIIGWLIHFLIGTVVWGGAFAMIHDHLPDGSLTAKGVVFAIGAWILMMTLVMPVAGAGLFGMKMGIMAPIMTLILHVIYGAVLGFVFQMLTAPKVQHS